MKRQPPAADPRQATLLSRVDLARIIVRNLEPVSAPKPDPRQLALEPEAE